MANAWFRMYHEFATDPKVQMLSEVEQRRYVMILCIRLNNDKAILLEEMAFYLRVDSNSLEKTKQSLVENELITDDWFPVKPLETTDERLPWNIWKETRERIFARDNYTCQYCGSTNVDLQCDHILPLAKGGSNEDDNLVAACVVCNRDKSDKLLSEWSRQ
ncbi:HNH endonuclease [Methylobacter sp. Wu1]|uniref:HNH endonuclease n=1 Tax=Methylobacter sp. Wu1 TaxID=3119359 RepID=UPI002F95B93F